MLRRQHSVSMQRPRTVTNARSLQGLMKWLSRAEWRDRFAEVYDHHLLPACRRTGFDAEEVIEILGESWFRTTVWGCAFEDFLTSEGPGGRNIVDDLTREAALLLFNLVHVTVSTICRISFVCAQARIETE
jgi:hypothetical protein